VLGVRRVAVDLAGELGEPVGRGWHRDPADDRGQVDDVRAAAHRLARLLELAQVALVDLAALAHPHRRLALIGDADLELGVTQQPPHDRGADRAGAAGDEHPAHHALNAATSAT
jgi:hypothetical protein